MRSEDAFFSDLFVIAWAMPSVKRVRRRATAVASAMPIWSGRYMAGVTSCCTTCPRGITSTVRLPSTILSPLPRRRMRRRVEGSSSSSHVVLRTTRVRLSIPFSDMGIQFDGYSAPSTTSRMWGRGPWPAVSWRNSPRVSTPGPMSSSSSSALVETIRAGPTASSTSSERQWGSHFTQSHMPMVSSPARTAIRRSAGGTMTARWAIMARSCASVRARGPHSSTVRNWSR